MQVLLSCLLSLFASKDDAMEIHGAAQWLVKAYEDYHNRVINHKIGYKAFMEEYHARLTMPIFLEESCSYGDLLQEVTDRNKVKHILINRKFTEENFATDSFEEVDAIRMIAKYNAIGIKKEVSISNEFLPLVDYPQEAKDGLSEVFRKYKLLSPDIPTEDLILLLTTGRPSCKYMISACARNVDVGLVINMLSTAGALGRKWSTVICSPGMLLSTSGMKMQAKNLSAAMHRFDGFKLTHLNERQKGIVRDVIKALQGVPNAIKRLK